MVWGRDQGMEVASGIARVWRGPGCAAALSVALRPYRRVAVVRSRAVAAAELSRRLCGVVAEVVELRTAGEPSDLWVDDARAALGSEGVEAVVSIGGGSALDAGKALAVMCREEGATRELLEGVGTRAPRGEMLPWFALPTTAGTGSEASTNAVLSRPGPGGFKKSLRHPAFRAAAVFLDAELLAGLPAAQAAASGMDALTQLFESWLSRRCPAELAPRLKEALLRADRALPRAVAGEEAARQEMLESAFWSGLGLSRAGLGTVHGLAGPIGARTGLSHARICARLFGPWIGELWGMPAAAERLEELRAAGGRPGAWEDLAGRLGVAPLGGLEGDAREAVLAAGSDRDSPFPIGRAGWERLLDLA